MWEFIVSGRLPGTAIQVSFETWSYIIVSVASLTIVFLLIRFIVARRRVANLLILRQVLQDNSSHQRQQA